MKQEIPAQRTDQNIYDFPPPFSHSVLAAVWRRRNANYVADVSAIELAVATGELVIDRMSDTVDLL